MTKRATLVGVLLLGLCGGLAAGWFAHQVTGSSIRVMVPNVVGLSARQAATVLKRAGLSVSLIPSPATTLPNHPHVATQQPPAGTIVRPGSTIRLVMPFNPAA